MQITIYNAISADGFIARENDDTSWVSETDWSIFKKLVKESKAIIMGKRTYEHSGEDFPYQCELNIVVTHDKNLHSQSTEKVWFTDKPLKEIVTEVEKKGFNTLLGVGGGNLNSQLLKKNLVDKVIVDVHPIILGTGISMFGSDEANVILEREKVENHKEGLVQITYRVKK